MKDLYPGYDVLAKRNSLSWNDLTREVIDARLAIDPDAHVFFSDAEFLTLKALAACIIPQPVDRARPVPLAAMVDGKLARGERDGYRDARMPRADIAWQRGLKALDAEAGARHGTLFHKLGGDEQDALLADIQSGKAACDAWGDLPPALFFGKRVLHDIVSAYYSHPTAWSEIGFGGPTGPRGYVRMDYDRRDPWEAAEAKPGHEAEARRENARVG